MHAEDPGSRVYAYATPFPLPSPELSPGDEIVSSMHGNHVVDVRVERRRTRHMPPPQSVARRRAPFPNLSPGEPWCDGHATSLALHHPQPRRASLTTHYFRVRGNIPAAFYSRYKPPAVPLPGKLGFEPHRSKIILPSSFLFSSTTVFYFYAPPISASPPLPPFPPRYLFPPFSLYSPGPLCQYMYI